MKWWHWLFLELLIIFAVIAWIYLFPSEEFEGDFVKGMIGFVLIHAIEECKDINRRKTMDYKEGMTCGECLKYEFCPVANHNTNHKACMKITTKEYHTIEQNAGENQIEGGVISISGSVDTFRCWKCGRTLPISERTNIVYASNPPRYSCKECEGIKKEKQYRQFKDCNELIEHYQKKYKSAAGCDIYFPSLYKPSIWVKNRNDYTERLIVTFGEDFVKVGSKTKPISLYVLFTDYEFLDGTPCGITE